MPALDLLDGRTFSFHPPIRNIRHNQWVIERTTWSECWIANVQSRSEFAIPLSFIGAISHLDDPVAVVALRRQLKQTSGKIVPLQRTVWELPPPSPESAHPARATPGIGTHIEGIRIEPDPHRQFARRTTLALLLGALLYTIFLGIEGGRDAPAP